MGAKAKQYHAAREEARRHADAHPSPNADPGEALQWIVNRVFDQLRYAATKADAVPEDEVEIMTPFGPVSHQWIRAEERLRVELSSLCVNVERVGLAERMVRIQEARALLIVQALTEACADAGIPRSKLKQIGPAFRERLALIEGSGEGDGNSTARGRVKVA